MTSGPGLAGALLVGVAAAKAYSLALDVPLYGVNHLAAHVAVDVLEHGPLPQPAIAVLVSGGHSSILRVDDVTRTLEPLGATVDDAAGEAFDKVARLLGLGFPGGPVVDRTAREGDRDAIAFPRSMLREQTYDVSFSGLKTAVARWVEARQAAGEPVPVADVCASFQEAVVDVLTAKAVRACADAGVEHLLLGGGVAANSRLRALAQERCDAVWIVLRVPRPGLCTDNGAMVAALGARLVDRMLGGRAAVRRRLDALATDTTVEDFRVEQVVWGGLGLLGAAVIATVGSVAAGGLNVLSAGLLCVAGLLGGVLGRDWWLTQQVQRREELLLAEFPVVAELLALAVTAGESPTAAIARVYSNSRYCGSARST